MILNRKPPISRRKTARGGAILFLNMDDPSQLPAAAEPFFQAFNAEIECTPAMTAEDLMKAGDAIEDAVKKYS